MRWVKRATPDDRSDTPRSCRVVTNEYRQAVLSYRQGHPTHGPIRIAAALQAQFPQAHRGTISRILRQEKLSQSRALGREA